MSSKSRVSFMQYILILLFNYDFSVLSKNKQRTRITKIIANFIFISYISKYDMYILIVFKYNSNTRKKLGKYTCRKLSNKTKIL